MRENLKYLKRDSLGDGEEGERTCPSQCSADCLPLSLQLLLLPPSSSSSSFHPARELLIYAPSRQDTRYYSLSKLIVDTSRALLRLSWSRVMPAKQKNDKF